jgi:hypothetical protein
VLHTSPTLDALASDDHDDPLCTCDSCERERDRGESRALAREARTRGGLFPLAHALLGVGWLHGDTNKGAAMALDTGALAQRSLGDIFEQLEAIGASGRTACKGAAYTSSPEPVNRREIYTLLSLVENLHNYAHKQLEHICTSRFMPGDRVIYSTRDGNVAAEVIEASRANRCVIHVDGEPPERTTEAHPDRLTQVAQ